MQTVRTFTATIYCGFKKHNSNTVYTLQDALNICQSYVDEVGLCVTVTPTQYVYTKGLEQGVMVGLIHYPRFPDELDSIRKKAIVLSELLMTGLEQQRVSVVFPDETVMLTNKLAF